MTLEEKENIIKMLQEEIERLRAENQQLLRDFTPVMRRTPDEWLKFHPWIAVNFACDEALKASFEDAISDITTLHLENERLRSTQNWLTLEEFKREANEGYCWIFYKGIVIQAYYAGACFKHQHWDLIVYMTECITHVMPIDKPSNPS